MKSIKEKQLFVKWSKAMNQPVDQTLLEEVERYERLQQEIVESVRQNSIKDLTQASRVSEDLVVKETEFPKPPTLDEVLEVLKEETNELVQPQTEQTIEASEPTATIPSPETLVDKAVKHITREVKLEEKADSYQQPDSEITSRGVEDIRRKIKYLEDWVAKISLTGPGGGAGDVINLDFPVKLVTGNYTITRKDYYIGVNATSAVTITLPSSIGFPGRKVVIKDESGNCSSNPITVNGTVDNDSGGFILQMDNGGIQMIYREGWRII